MRIKITGWLQVVEYSLAKHMLYWAGLGQRREDADNLRLFPTREAGFYVKRGVQEHIASLVVDEGIYDGALHRKNKEETEVGISGPWYEYVDASHLMRILCDKLVPTFKPTPSTFIGAGKTQHHYMEQHVAQLLQWSKNDPNHWLQFE